MNPVLILTHNCLEMTKRCVESVDSQDIPTKTFLFDNGSTDGTRDWCISSRHIENSTWWDCRENLGVSCGWNQALGLLFHQPDIEHVLVANNDTILPPWCYSSLLSFNLPFVTGSSVELLSQIETKPTMTELVPHPDFSLFLIRREAWEAIGQFDESMKHYASDCDYHVRGHRAGIQMMRSNIPFYHERSSTIRLASPREKLEISRQADLDRAAFKAKWGCEPGSREYPDLFL